MSTIFFQLVIALLVGIVLGIISVQNNSLSTSSSDSLNITANDLPGIPENSFAEQHIKTLEAEVLRLKQRVIELEQLTAVNKLPVTEVNNEAAPAQAEAVEQLTIDNLVAAGVSKNLAEDILRRQSEYEFKLLELSDRAIRENYIKTPRYFQEYRKLTSEAVSIRDEIGVDSYDNYLYATDQDNRVVVQSVMAASPAEQHGIQAGDVVISYADKKILEWRDLSQATTEGVRGEYVGINLLRNNQLMNIMVPRGPLGVKLGTVKLDPGEQYSY